jgi:hypothetical protein
MEADAAAVLAQVGDEVAAVLGAAPVEDEPVARLDHPWNTATRAVRPCWCPPTTCEDVMYNPVEAPPKTARRGRIALAGAAAVACLALSACSGPLDMPSTGSASGGDRGNSGGGHSWAPPIKQPVFEPPYTHPGPNLDHGCADGASANGFACVSVPDTGDVIYPGPDPDPDPNP